MEDFITALPGTILGWVAVITVVIAGGLALYGLYDKQARDRKKDLDGSEDRLIEILQKTVKELEDTTKKQTTDIERLSNELVAVRAERKTLLDILQGRDDQTQMFYKQAFESMKTVRDTHDAVTTIAEGFKTTNKNMTDLISLLGKHAEIIDHAAVAATGAIKNK